MFICGLLHSYFVFSSNSQAKFLSSQGLQSGFAALSLLCNCINSFLLCSRIQSRLLETPFHSKCVYYTEREFIIPLLTLPLVTIAQCPKNADLNHFLVFAVTLLIVEVRLAIITTQVSGIYEQYNTHCWLGF